MLEGFVNQTGVKSEAILTKATQTITEFGHGFCN